MVHLDKNGEVNDIEDMIIGIQRNKRQDRSGEKDHQDICQVNFYKQECTPLRSDLECLSKEYQRFSELKNEEMSQQNPDTTFRREHLDVTQ